MAPIFDFLFGFRRELHVLKIAGSVAGVKIAPMRGSALGLGHAQENQAQVIRQTSWCRHRSQASPEGLQGQAFRVHEDRRPEGRWSLHAGLPSLQER